MGRRLLEGYALGFETSLVMAAAGAIMGIRVGVSLLLGAIAFYAVLGPQLAARGIVTEPGYVHLVRWTVWPASAMMVAAGLVAFALRWRTIVRAMAGLAAVLGWKSQRDDPLARIEVPGSWFALGTITSGIACVLLGNFLFDIPWWMGVLAVLMTFFLSVVAARATGETDITPVSAMGKITQLAFGAIAPPSAATPWTAALTTNLMTANITAGAASHSADLLTDLKSGYLLGGNPRKQTISQLFGVLAGTLFCVPVYSLIVHTPELPVAQAGAAEAGSAASQATNLGTEEFPAPSARVWQAVAEMMAKGTGASPRRDRRDDRRRPGRRSPDARRGIRPPAIPSLDPLGHRNWHRRRHSRLQLHFHVPRSRRSLALDATGAAACRRLHDSRLFGLDRGGIAHGGRHRALAQSVGIGVGAAGMAVVIAFPCYPHQWVRAVVPPPAENFLRTARAARKRAGRNPSPADASLPPLP